MIKNIIFDFDGVILDSIPVKTQAFRKLFESFEEEEVKLLIEFHIQNGGMSRYKKIEYFFTNILNQSIEYNDILQYAHRYSLITKEELSKPKYLIEDTKSFIQNNFQYFNLHIASGADEEDLQYICNSLKLSQYFLSIHGSPKAKNDIVRNILKKSNYKQDETILIGDSINDYEAAFDNKIKFYGYNNESLKRMNGIVYINKMDTFEKNLQIY